MSWIDWMAGFCKQYIHRSVSKMRSPSTFTRQKQQWDNRNKKYFVFISSRRMKIALLTTTYIWLVRKNVRFSFFLNVKLEKENAKRFSSWFSLDILRLTDTRQFFWSTFSVPNSLSKISKIYLGLDNLFKSIQNQL